MGQGPQLLNQNKDAKPKQVSVQSTGKSYLTDWLLPPGGLLQSLTENCKMPFTSRLTNIFV